MKAKLAFPVEELTGRTGTGTALVASVWRGIQTFRRYTTPRNPDTAYQQNVRSVLTQAAQGYSLISAENKATWENYAADHQITVNGSPVVLPANAVYNRINSLRLLAGEALSATAPTNLCTFSITSVSSVEYATATDTLTINIAHTLSSFSAEKVLIEVTQPLRNAINNVTDNDYRYAGTVMANSFDDMSAVSPMDITSVTRFEWEDGDTMAVRLTPLSDDYDPGTPYVIIDTISVT